MVTTDQIAEVDAAYWANMNRIRLQKGVWSFGRRQYLLEPMQEQVRRTCYMKGTQGGFTELEVNKSLHGMIYGKYPRGVLYLFPTANDIRDFSHARFGPLISSNPQAIGQYVRSTNSAHLKRVKDAFLYLRGGTLPKALDFDAREAASLRGISVDKVVFDEVDLMDAKAVAKAKQRMGDSDVKEEVYISNPTLPDFGIAEVFNRSDQRHWFRKCGCGEFTCAELDFPSCVKYRKDGTGYIACKKCGSEVLPDPGEWVPAEREKSAYMHGYRWSQLSSYQNDPGEILNEFNDPPEGNLGDIIRLRLGLPYVGVDERLSMAEVLSCCGEYNQMAKHKGPCAMGIDCEKPKRIVIGARTGKDSYSIFRVAGSSDPEWNEIVEWVRKFHVKSIVVDIRPYEDAARTFRARMRRLGVIVYLCEYSESSPLGETFNTKTGICKVNRTEALDASHRLVITPGMLTLPRRCPQIEQYAEQMCATAKTEVIDKRSNRPIFRYIGKLGGKPDDYRHATTYFYLACKKGRVGTANIAIRKQRATYATNNRSYRRMA